MHRLLPIALAAMAFLASCGESPQSDSNTPGTVSNPTTENGFSLPDLESRQRHLDEWAGEVVLLNFWAPWCPPCREEIPDFIALQEKYADKGFTVVGITLDTRDNAQTFADTMGINYPVLVAEDEGIEIARRYGNRVGALPYSVLLDRQGRTVLTQRNILTLEQAEKALLPLL